MTAELFKHELATAFKAYEHYIVCLDKTPEQFMETLQSLLGRAIREFENRGPHQRHGIALDRYVTVIISQTEGPRPLCGIYFNLNSPYLKKSTGASARLVEKKIEERHPKREE